MSLFLIHCTILVVTGMDTPKYGETLKFMYIKYQPILVVLPFGPRHAKRARTTYFVHF